jgi:putative transposase
MKRHDSFDHEGAQRRANHPATRSKQRRPATSGNRRSIRLVAHDCASAGAYFVTICTQDRKPLLLSRQAREAVEHAWRWLAQRFPQTTLDEFIVMPDHVHFVIWVRESEALSGGHPAAQGAQTRAPTLGSIVGAFKTVVARSINAQRGTVGARVWQRNYFERVIRDEDELERIREYIRNNSLMAHDDPSDDHASAWRSRS